MIGIGVHGIYGYVCVCVRVPTIFVQNFAMALINTSRLLTLSLANGCNFTTSFAQACQHANDIHSRHYE